MNQYKMCAFDVDGVLVDSAKAHYWSLHDAIEMVTGHSITQHHLDPLGSLSTTQKLKLLQQSNTIPLLSKSQFDQIVKLKFDGMATYDYMLHYNKHISRIFEHLEVNGIQIYVVSNSRLAHCQQVLKQLGCHIPSMNIICNNSSLPLKPASDMYNCAILRSGVLPSDVLIFEDSKEGLAAAIGSGANVFKVDDASHLTYELVKDLVSGDNEMHLHQRVSKYCTTLSEQIPAGRYIHLNPGVDSGITIIP